MCWNSSYTSNVLEQFLHFKCVGTVLTLHNEGSEEVWQEAWQDVIKLTMECKFDNVTAGEDKD